MASRIVVPFAFLLINTFALHAATALTACRRRVLDVERATLIADGRAYAGQTVTIPLDAPPP
jgi:hypothetical protein